MVNPLTGKGRIALQDSYLWGRSHVIDLRVIAATDCHEQSRAVGNWVERRGSGLGNNAVLREQPKQRSRITLLQVSPSRRIQFAVHNRTGGIAEGQKCQARGVSHYREQVTVAIVGFAVERSYAKLIEQ